MDKSYTTDSTATTTASQPQYVRNSEPDSNRIRMNLMTKLGVNKIEPCVITLTEARRDPSRGSMLGKVNCFTEPLKGNEKDRSSGDNLFQNLANFFFRPKPTPQDDEAPPLDESSQRSISTSTSSTSFSDGDDEDASSKSSADTQTRRLTFNEEVSVCPIPKREEYSKRIRERLWQSPEEMMRNCRRNSLEFAAEGWDWRNSMEDEHMYRCIATNEMIHPVHIEGMPAEHR